MDVAKTIKHSPSWSKACHEKSAEVIVCDLKVVTLIAEMLLLLSRSIPIDKCLVRNEQCKAIETK